MFSIGDTVVNVNVYVVVAPAVGSASEYVSGPTFAATMAAEVTSAVARIADEAAKMLMFKPGTPAAVAPLIMLLNAIETTLPGLIVVDEYVHVI